MPAWHSAPRTARLQLADDVATHARLPFLPAVRLSAGHLPLTSDALRSPGCRVLAADADGGAPVVVILPVLAGHVIYSSAHWTQDEPVDMTRAGQRPLFATPVYAALGGEFPHVSVSEFHAALAMLSILSAGIELALAGSVRGRLDSLPGERGVTDERDDDDAVA